jgi:hypothetical protein
MALQSTSKATGMARDIADKMKMRFKGGAGINHVREALDANGWPMLFMSNGSEAAGQPVIGLRIKNLDVGAKDIFGNSSLPFAPHTCEIAFELNGAGAPTPSTSDLSQVLAEAARYGMILQEKAIANATAVTEASMNAASPSLTINDIDNPNKGV